MGLEVIIAVHPRADYDVRGGDMFGGRQIINGDSARLVRSARLVISHYSTAIGFAAAFSKPVLLVGSREIWAGNSFARRSGAAFADALRSELFSLDDVDAIDLTGVLDFDQAAYYRYVADHLKTPEIADKPLWQFIAATFGEMFPDTRPKSRGTMD
jgi:hypothetical protein